MARILNLIKSTFHCKQCHRSNIFTTMDLFFIFLSIGSFLTDIATDIIVIYQYYINNHFVWVILTTSLVCIPSVIVQIFSIRWFISDGKATNFVWMVHVLQLGLLYRFLQLLKKGCLVKKNKSMSDLANFHHQQSDICMLRLFESFTESAPQLVLQLYIMISTDDWNPWTGVSAIASIVSLSWGISAYSKAMRNVRPEKQIASWWSLLFQAMWRIGMVFSRIVAMVLFAVVFSYWLILAVGVHWLVMVFWIFTQNTDFCSTWWEERLYNAVVGVIYCFCYFNVKEGRSRHRMLFYYSATLLQNVSFAAAFYLSETNVRWKSWMAGLVPVSAIIGLISMLLYYRFFHPSGPITWFGSIESGDCIDAPKANTSDLKCMCSTLKTCRKVVEAPAEHSIHQENLSLQQLNASMMSLRSLDNNRCKDDLHRSHSLNCSIGALADPSTEPQRKIPRKSIANHHRNINYHFRPAAAFGTVSLRTHCSCLILVSEPKNCLETSCFVKEKLSNSLPNLDISFESENNDDTIKNSFEDCSTGVESNTPVHTDQHEGVLIKITSDNCNKIKETNEHSSINIESNESISEQDQKGSSESLPKVMLQSFKCIGLASKFPVIHDHIVRLYVEAETSGISNKFPEISIKC